MAIVDGLCTLAQLKAQLRISDSSQDTFLEGIINDVSAKIVEACKRPLKRATYTSEPYAVNNSLFLYLNAWPIQSVASVVVSGAALASSSDAGYYMSGEDALAGRLYRVTGWTGPLINRGTFPDPFAGTRAIAVTYTAGYYLPADVGYVAGAAASLPMGLTYACVRECALRYRQTVSNADGLKSLSEGGLSYTWADVAGSFGGLSADTYTTIKPYIKPVLA